MTATVTSPVAVPTTLPKFDRRAMHWAFRGNHHVDPVSGQTVTETLCGLPKVPVIAEMAAGAGGRQMCARCAFLYAGLPS